MFVVGPSWGLRVGVGFFGCPRIPAASAIIHLAQPSPSILENSLFVAFISEAVTRMEYGDVVDVLYIALFEVGRYTETLA